MIMEKKIKTTEEIANKPNEKVPYNGYKCRNFALYELLPKELYVDEETGWDMFDERLLRTIDIVRDILGVGLTCNNWKFGGKRNYCGGRTKDSDVYNYGSYHSIRKDRKVMAVDLISPKMTAEKMRQTLVSNAKDLPYPIRVEAGVSWLHIDVAAVIGYKIYFFNA